jgi:hypothetical protein
MKLIAYFLSILTLTIFLSHSLEINAILLDRAVFQDPQLLVSSYFQCLKEGDINNLRRLLGGNLLQKKIKLLNNNPSYSSFLKNLYQDSALESIELIESGKNKITCKMHISFGDSISIFSLILTRTNDIWQITDEITP